MKVVVVGAHGMLGHTLCDVLTERGHEPLPRVRADESPLPRADALVNCAAWTPSSSAATGGAQNDELALRTNAVLPHRLALAFDGPVVHISTDGVFASAGPHDETHAPDDVTPYGLSKRVGEPPEAMVLRVSHVGAEHGRARHLLSRLASARELVGYTDHQWNGVTTLTLARAITDILAHGMFSRGVFHLFGNDVTKADLCRRLVRAFSLPVVLRDAASGAPRDRRLRTVHALRDRLALPALDTQIDELVAWVRAPARRARYRALVDVAGAHEPASTSPRS